MDVSNSTGQNTSYRVLGGGGAAPKPPKGRGRESDEEKVLKDPGEPLTLHTGTLEPNTYVTLPLPPDTSACKVQFHREGKLIAQQEIKGDEGRYEVLVALVPNGKGAPKPYVCRRKV
ncbi:MAG TPA: hypothetical protein VL025_14865 [Thermoanaerobaculia bacterium]|nr:hypothetical protein [Thermoanaerobaculia bacterium]